MIGKLGNVPAKKIRERSTDILTLLKMSSRRSLQNKKTYFYRLTINQRLTLLLAMMNNLPVHLIRTKCKQIAYNKGFRGMECAMEQIMWRKGKQKVVDTSVSTTNLGAPPWRLERQTFCSASRRSIH